MHHRYTRRKKRNRWIDTDERISGNTFTIAERPATQKGGGKVLTYVCFLHCFVGGFLVCSLVVLMKLFTTLCASSPSTFSRKRKIKFQGFSMPRFVISVQGLNSFLCLSPSSPSMCVCVCVCVCVCDLVSACLSVSQSLSLSLSHSHTHTLSLSHTHTKIEGARDRDRKRLIELSGTKQGTVVDFLQTFCAEG